MSGNFGLVDFVKSASAKNFILELFHTLAVEVFQLFGELFFYINQIHIVNDKFFYQKYYVLIFCPDNMAVIPFVCLCFPENTFTVVCCKENHFPAEGILNFAPACMAEYSTKVAAEIVVADYFYIKTAVVCVKKIAFKIFKILRPDFYKNFFCGAFYDFYNFGLN